MIRVHNCFDSHVHWLATGRFADFYNLKSIAENFSLDERPIEKQNFQGEWLVGFGWDQNLWSKSMLPHRKQIDKQLEDIPAFFSRVDGHAALLNTRGLKVCGLLDQQGNSRLDQQPWIQWKNQIHLDSDGNLSGVVFESAKEYIQTLFAKPQEQQIQRWLRRGQEIFLKKGFTHIRDMSGDQYQWEQILKMDQMGNLLLRCYGHINVTGTLDAPSAIDLIQHIEIEYPTLLPLAIKVYYDGALGSEGALLSQPYVGKNHNGFRLIDPIELQELLQLAWRNRVSVSVHGIGDEACDQIANAALNANRHEPCWGLSIEHAQLIRPETVSKLEQLRAVVYMQPCHYLSDRKWLAEKVGELKSTVFSWQQLEQQGVPFYFGSDSPVEPPDLFANQMAVQAVQQDFKERQLQHPWYYYQQALDDFSDDTYSEFSDQGELLSVTIQNERLDLNSIV